MTPAQRRYIMIETLISVVINSAISFAFAWLMFSASSAISTRALQIDSIPQSFMITLMSVVVPGMLAARRLKSGRLAAIASASAPWPLGRRALLVAVLATASGFAAHGAVLSLWSPGAISFPAVLAIKVAYGVALAAFVTPLMLRYALRTRLE